MQRNRGKQLEWEKLEISLRMWSVFLAESCQIPESSLHVSVRTLYESPSPWQTYCTQPSDSHQCTPEWQHQTWRHHCFLLVLRKTWEGKRLNCNKYVMFYMVAWLQAKSVMRSQVRQEGRQWGINGYLVMMCVECACVLRQLFC